MEERRMDMSKMLKAISDQNDLLAAQNILLMQIVAFITPVSAFFSAFKNFVIGVAWIVGLLSAGYGLWQSFVTWIKH